MAAMMLIKSQGFKNMYDPLNYSILITAVYICMLVCIFHLHNCVCIAIVLYCMEL